MFHPPKDDDDQLIAKREFAVRSVLSLLKNGAKNARSQRCHTVQIETQINGPESVSVCAGSTNPDKPHGKPLARSAIASATVPLVTSDFQRQNADKMKLRSSLRNA
jgi:hypothetical protein